MTKSTDLNSFVSKDNRQLLQTAVKLKIKTEMVAQQIYLTLYERNMHFIVFIFCFWYKIRLAIGSLAL